jgi:hypothetical protein
MGLQLHIGARGTPEPYGDHVPTDEVFAYLDAKYGLVADFVKRHETEIAELAAAGMMQSIEAMIRRDKSPKYAAIIDAGNKIAEMLRKDIQLKRFDHLPGLPSQAAIEGRVMFGRTVVHNTGRVGKRRIPGRPSFIFSFTMLNDLMAYFTDDTGQFAPKDAPP